MKNPIRLRGGISISPSQEEMIDKVLSTQFEKIQARLLLLLDINGQVISFQGERGHIDVIALGALIAGDMAASQEIAKISNIYQENQMVIRQGSKMNTIIYEVDRNLLLLFIVPASVPIGWVCYLVRETAGQIKHTLSKTEYVENTSVFPTSEEKMEDLVSDALDKVWKD
jgi:predicted regulator of Ras-like GTPase activity (Roadblock/LC7/MglB family)